MGQGPKKQGSGKEHQKQPGKLRRVRLIPAAHSSLFPDATPLEAYLKPTEDPHIWKIVATKKRDSATSGAPGSRSSGSQPGSGSTATAGQSSAAQGAGYSNASGSGAQQSFDLSPAGELADSVLYSIIEATDLLLDEAPIQLKEQVFRTSHHALRLLLKVKQSRTGAEQKQALDLLRQVLDDLQRLRGIADEEERFLKEGESLDL